MARRTSIVRKTPPRIQSYDQPLSELIYCNGLVRGRVKRSGRSAAPTVRWSPSMQSVWTHSRVRRSAKLSRHLVVPVLGFARAGCGSDVGCSPAVGEGGGCHRVAEVLAPAAGDGFCVVAVNPDVGDVVPGDEVVHSDPGVVLGRGWWGEPHLDGRFVAGAGIAQGGGA
jgi:hypothetical protein